MKGSDNLNICLQNIPILNPPCMDLWNESLTAFAGPEGLEPSAPLGEKGVSPRHCLLSWGSCSSFSGKQVFPTSRLPLPSPFLYSFISWLGHCVSFDYIIVQCLNLIGKVSGIFSLVSDTASPFWFSGGSAVLWARHSHCLPLTTEGLRLSGTNTVTTLKKWSREASPISRTQESICSALLKLREILRPSLKQR